MSGIYVIEIPVSQRSSGTIVPCRMGNSQLVPINQPGNRDVDVYKRQGGDKPASRNQPALIRNKAQEQRRNPEELAASRFGKRLQDLKGCEADSLIKGLLMKAR